MGHVVHQLKPAGRYFERDDTSRLTPAAISVGVVLNLAITAPVTVATSAFQTSRSRFLFRLCLGKDRVSVVGAVGDGARATKPWLLVREGLGILAGATIQRAC